VFTARYELYLYVKFMLSLVFKEDHAIVQAVIRRPLNSEARVQF
jgi:hypothetical protein